MKVAVIGSRSIGDIDIQRFIPPEATLIISGGANGIDTLAEKYADENGIEKLIIRPNYELYGKSAPLVRDKLIVDYAETVVAIWDGSSSGTGFTISYAKQQNVHCEIYIIQD